MSDQGPITVQELRKSIEQREYVPTPADIAAAILKRLGIVPPPPPTR